MAAAPFRPPWFGNVGVQVLAGVAIVYNLYQLARNVVDEQYGEAFLSFAWCVLFGYVLLESQRTRKQQQAVAGDDAPADTTD
jgi:heme A synthase